MGLRLVGGDKGSQCGIALHLLLSAWLPGSDGCRPQPPRQVRSAQAAYRTYWYITERRARVCLACASKVLYLRTSAQAPTDACAGGDFPAADVMLPGYPGQIYGALFAYCSYGAGSQIDEETALHCTMQSVTLRCKLQTTAIYMK